MGDTTIVEIYKMFPKRQTDYNANTFKDLVMNDVDAMETVELEYIDQLSKALLSLEHSVFKRSILKNGKAVDDTKPKEVRFVLAKNTTRKFTTTDAPDRVKESESDSYFKRTVEAAVANAKDD